MRSQGIAIIIVMISILVLAVLAGGFAWSMKVETRLAYNANSEDELESLGRSGVEYCRNILAMEMLKPVQYDALNQVWAGGPGDVATTNTALVFVVKEVHPLASHGSFTWKITDCERKANINTANEVLLQQAMLQVGVDPSQSAQIIAAILDWIDPDNSIHLQGAETDYYENLNPPYQAKNGPIDDLSELLLIKDVTPDIYWGPASSNNIPGLVERRLNHFGRDANVQSYAVGLVDLFTPISFGKINLNTASASVLQLIPGVDPTIAAAIVAGREGEDDGSGLLGPYRNVNDLQRVPEVPRNIIPQVTQFCDVRSKTFEVQIDARIGNYTRTFHSVIARNNPNDMQVLSFYWK